MFCQAKICVLLVVASGITATAASLDSREKNTEFSTDQRPTASIIKPSETKSKLGTASRWKRVKVQKIKPVTQSPGSVEVNGFVFNRPADVPAGSTAKAPAVPAKK